MKVEYDMTVRNNKGKVTQFSYGDDNIDPCKIEGYNLGLLKLDIPGVYEHFDILLWPSNFKYMVRISK